MVEPRPAGSATDSRLGMAVTRPWHDPGNAKEQASMEQLKSDVGDALPSRPAARNQRPRRVWGILTMAEVQLWAALVRVLVATVSVDRAIRILDALPHRSEPMAEVVLPPEATFRYVGACLGRSLAR